MKVQNENETKSPKQKAQNTEGFIVLVLIAVHIACVSFFWSVSNSEINVRWPPDLHGI